MKDRYLRGGIIMKLYKKMIVAVFSILTTAMLFAVGPQRLYLPEDKVYIEVEIDGDKVGKWVSINDIKEYDAKGRLLRCNYRYNIHEYKYYGDGNKPIYIENIEGASSYKDLYEYDKHGNMIYEKQRNGSGGEYWYEYDKYGNVIYMKENNRGEQICTYECKYDSNNKIIYGKKSCYCDDGSGNKEYHYENRFWYEYDKNGNKIHEWDSDGNESWYEYNESEKVIYSKFKEAYDRNDRYSQIWYEYDENGNITLKRDDQCVYVHKLEYWEDGKTLKKDTCYYYEKN